MPDLATLPDDQLTAHLRDAFRESTRDLAYRGAVPAPRSALWTAVPSAAVVAAAVGAIAVAPSLAGHDGGSATPIASASATTSGAATPGGDVNYSLAAFKGFAAHDGTMPSIVLSGSAAQQNQRRGPFRVTADAAPPPSDARQIELVGPGEAYVGTDPANDQATLWVKVPTRNGNRMFSLTSPLATEDLLLRLLVDPAPGN